MSEPVAEALGWTLLHALWQGFALVLPTAILLHLLRTKSSNLRYRISSFTLLAQLFVSIATFAWYYQPVTTLVQPALTESLPANWQTITQSLGRQPLPWQQQAKQFLETHLSHFVLIYLIGVALFGIRLAGGWIYLQRLSRTATLPSATLWIELTDTLRSTLAIRAAIQVRESIRITVPMVVGILKPVLLIPVGLATNLSIQEAEAILAHELAHVKRHDYAVNLLQSVMEVLYFFHPALWWLSARVREEREHCCDDLAVIAIGGNGRMLAQALARVEEIRLTQMAKTPALAMAFASKRQHLLHRVRRMLGVPTRPFISNSSLAGLTLATLLLVSISVYAVQQDAPQLKFRKTQSQASQRHKVDSNTGFGFTDNKTIDYIIWQGKKLPAAHIARLQTQYDQVMARKLLLNAVEQPDYAILLTIIGLNNPLNGEKEIVGRLGKSNYDDILGSSVATVFNGPSNTGSPLGNMDKINYTHDFSEALVIGSFRQPQTGSLDMQRAHLQRQVDSLPDLLAHDDQVRKSLSRLWQDNASLHEQMNEHKQSFEELFTRVREPFEQRQRLMKEQLKLQQQATLLRDHIKNQAFLPVKEILVDEITATEKNLSVIKQRIDNLTKTEIRPFINTRTHFQHFRRMDSLMNSIRSNEGQIIDLESKLETGDSDGVNFLPKAPERVKPAIPARPAVPPHPAKAPNVVVPTTPAAPDLLDVPAVPPVQKTMPRARGKATPGIAPIPALPAAPATPRPAPKPDDEN